MKSQEGRCRSAEFTLGPKSIKPDINEAIEFVLIAVAKETIVHRFFLPLFLRVLDSSLALDSRRVSREKWYRSYIGIRDRRPKNLF